MTGADLSAILKKHPLSVVCGLITVVCAALLYYRADNITASQAELEARTAEANKMIANVRNSANLAEQVTEIQAQRKELEGRLMKAGQLAVNLQYFYKLETETEVKLADVRQGNISRNGRGQFAGIPFSVTVEGTYAQVVNFLGRLQAGRHFCRITSANFTKASGSNMPGAADMTLSLNLELLGQP